MLLSLFTIFGQANCRLVKMFLHEGNHEHREGNDVGDDDDDADASI